MCVGGVANNYYLDTHVHACMHVRTCTCAVHDCPPPTPPELLQELGVLGCPFPAAEMLRLLQAQAVAAGAGAGG